MILLDQIPNLLEVKRRGNFSSKKKKKYSLLEDSFDVDNAWYSYSNNPEYQNIPLYFVIRIELIFSR